MKRAAALLLVFALLLQAPVLAVDSGHAPADSLFGKTLLILGDSYTADFGLEDPTQGWTHLLAERYSLTELNYSISGSTFGVGEYGSDPMVERCRDLQPDASVDIVLLQGGSNDHFRSIPLGTVTDQVETTCLGAVNLILDTLQQKFPQAKIILFTPWISSGIQNPLGLTSEDYTEGLIALCQARNVLCYDASDYETNGIRMHEEAFRRKYCYLPMDVYHLNADGHKLFAPVMGQWLSQTLYSVTPAEQFSDLQGADEDLADAVSQMLSAGILSGDTDRLFHPTRAADRQTLAMALYAIAGSPEASSLALSDVAPESPAYRAVCYGMDAGIFARSDTFSPNQVLSRQMLSVALCQYYTQVSGGDILQLTGLGGYPDGGQVAAYAKTAMGWALSCGLLPVSDGRLHPTGAVSRGELAQILRDFVAFLGENP